MNFDSSVLGRVSSRTRETRPGGFVVGPRRGHQQDLRHPIGIGRAVSRHGSAVRGAPAMQLHRGERFPERGGVPLVGWESPAGGTAEGHFRTSG